MHRKGERSKRGENSDGHPGGWPSLIHCEADVTARVPLPLSTYQRGRLTAGRGSRGFASLTFKSRSMSLMALEPLNGRFGCAVGHLHKAKAPGATGVTVSNNIDLVHHTIRLEELARS